MKRIKRIVCLVLLLALLLPATLSQAEIQYLIPDSDTRRLTEKEIWQFDRETMSYLFNEILARHGYVFSKGGKYDTWFRSMPWYTPDPKGDNNAAANRLSNLEWKNIALIKKVAADMDALMEKAHNPARKCIKDYKAPQPWKLTGFSYLPLQVGQRLPVYAAPKADSMRLGTKHNAVVSTNGPVWAAGVEKGWVLIMFQLTDSTVRVGYVQKSSIEGKVNIKKALKFDKSAATVTAPCHVTDDPMGASTTLRTLRKGDQVTYLTTCTNQDGDKWDYIETTVNMIPVRGFVPEGHLKVQK